MNCPDNEILENYIDGELEQSELILLRAHLQNCPACRKALNQLKLLEWELQRELAIPIPSQLEDLRQKTLQQYALTLEPDLEDAFGLRKYLQLQQMALDKSTCFTYFLPGQKLISLLGKKVAQEINPARLAGRIARR